MGKKCAKCGSENLIKETGFTVCGDCGVVVDETDIVIDEPTFSKESDGSSSIVGQFVPANGIIRTSSRGPGASSYAAVMGGSFCSESREATIENGRRKIVQLANILRVPPHAVDAAHRFFMLAVQHDFVKGRKTQYVAAACLYVVCRREKTSHMLVDFADAIGGNVYTLGGTFIKLCRVLNIQLPLVDPSLYIQRFAAQLNFGEKTLAVANTALRIVQRMGRDWIHTGRRPSGISGASLLISARMHGFETTPQDIVQVVRVCDSTLRRRLTEFADTNVAAAVTVGQLLDTNQTADVDKKMESEENAANPPAFTRALEKDEKEKAMVALWLRAQKGEDKEALLQEERERVRARRRRAKEGTDGSGSTKKDTGAEESDDSGKKTKKQRTKKQTPIKASKKTDKNRSDDVLRDVIGGEGEEDEEKGSDDEDEPADSVEKEIWETLQNSEFLTIEHTARRVLDRNARAFALSNVNPLAGEEVEPVQSDKTAAGSSSSGGDQEVIVGTVKKKPVTTLSTEDEPDTLEDIPDDEIDCYILTEEQGEMKKRAWEELYKDYIVEQEQKEAEQKEREKLNGGRSRNKRDGKGRSGGDGSIADATRQALQNRTSTRVNYAALGKLLTLDQDALAKGPLPYDQVRAAKVRARKEDDNTGEHQTAEGAANQNGNYLSLAQKIAREGEDEDEDEDDDDNDEEDDDEDGSARSLIRKKSRPNDDDDGFFDDF